MTVSIVQAVSSEELSNFRAFSESFFGKSISPLTQMEQWVSAGLASFTYVQNEGGVQAGYGLLYLSEEGVEDLIEGYANGATFTQKHLSTPEEAHAIYLASMMATTAEASASMFAHMWATLKTHRQNGLYGLYARTVSRDGVRVISGRRLRGRALTTGNCIYHADLRDSNLS